MPVKAVFFDVDFTLIYPGPTFRGEGYKAFCARYGIDVDATKFEQGVASAARILEGPDEYDPQVFVAYTSHIIETMGGRGPRVNDCAREIYDEVPGVLRELSAAGLRLGLISNSHRCLASFQSHFELQGLIAVAISGPEHGFMKPNPGIFREALRRAGVEPEASVMVGDSVAQDVEGAVRAGMRGILLHRGSEPHVRLPELTNAGVPVVGSLLDLRSLLSRLG